MNASLIFVMVAIAIGGVCITGLLFFKLVRVLSRLQLPQYPGR